MTEKESNPSSIAFGAAFLANLTPPLWRNAPALFPERLGSRVFAVAKDSFFDLASGDLHDMDGVADHVGGAILALRSGRHSRIPSRDRLLIDPLLNADFGRFCRAAYDIGSCPHFTRLNQLKLALELGSHFDPILNEVMDYSHDFTPCFAVSIMAALPVFPLLLDDGD